MKIEKDAAQVTAGVRHGRTLGGPVALQVANRDYKNWEERMNPWPVEADVPEVHLPRPGHADLAGVQKFGFTDVRNVLERASARETAARVAGGALAKAFLRALGVEVVSHVIQIGAGAGAAAGASYALADFADVDASPVRCLDADASKAMVEEINVLRKQQRVDRRDLRAARVRARARARLARLVGAAARRADRRRAALASRPPRASGSATGSTSPGRPGSEAHDEIFYSEERGYYRETNRSGGLEGGMTTGEPLVARVAMKPIPTLTKPLRSVDIATREPAQALRERTDSCVVPAAGVVGEAMLAIVLAGAYRDKFGGDHIDDVRARASAAYCERDRVESPGPSLHRVHGRRQDDRRPRGGRRAGRARGRHRPRARAAARHLDRGLLRLPRRAGVPRGRGGRRRRGARGAAGAGDLARRRRDQLRARARAARPPHGRDARRRRADRLAPRGRQAAARWRATASASPRCTPSARRCTSRWPTRCCLDGGAETDPARGGCAAADPGRREGRCGRSRASANYPVYVGDVLDGRFWPVRGRRFLLSDDIGRGRCTATGSRMPPRASTMPPGEEAKTLANAEGLLRGLAARRDGPRRPRGGAGRRRGRRRRGLLRRGLPARRRRRAGADDARRPGRLGLRRQDRRRPAGGQELRRRLPPAARRARRPADAGDAAGRRSSPRAGPR